MHRLLYTSNGMFSFYISIVFYATICCVDNCWYTILLLMSEAQDSVTTGEMVWQNLFMHSVIIAVYLPQRRKERTDNRQLADEIVRLVHACCGHALVLFTSYRQMAEVKAMTDGRWPYPTFQAWRNGGRVIQQFKESGNGILFAAGSCWEGIDFPGDMVSLLIIAKLPFPIPDPVSDYERRQYPNLRDYINAEIIPEMQKKLRQGFGRAIRTEQDSCVVAILDERAGIGGRYHDAALAALPICPTTEKIEDVQQFIREQKRPDYFL